MPKHVMLDLETWSTKTNATIISIGAVSFNPSHFGVEDRFHVAINPKMSAPSTRAALDIDPDTMLWWMDGDRALARAAWNAMLKLDLATALAGFSDWMMAQSDPDTPVSDDGTRSIPVWGNAASFDCSILRRSYEILGMTCPWAFWHDRCYRTVKNLGPNKVDIHSIEVPVAGVPHAALWDAERQALHLQRLLDRNGIVAR